ncbi:NAD-P-binding protein [Lactarius hengduanensis]|nr:NAD-P-binding protein [Lactarius hengduanensis]
MESLRHHVLRLPPFVQQLVLVGLVAFSASPIGILIGALLDLSRRLRGPHPRAAQLSPNYNEDDLDSVSYANVDMLNAIPREPTHAGYVVVGGSGFVGSYIVRLLVLRGETNVRVLDIVPPHEDFLTSHPAVTYTKVDITSPSSVHAALVAPFPSGALPSVIFHTAAAIRFWERAAYTFGASHRVNVLGTAAVLEAAKKLQTGAIVVYTSSAGVAVPAPRFMQNDKDYHEPPWDKISISDDDAPLNGPAKSTNCYARSKLMAERLVLEANSAGGLRTGCLRPGLIVTGPNDRFYTSTLVLPRVPVFDGLWSHTNVCVWDVAAAHLAFENALRRDPANVSGETFLITGNGPPWSMNNSRAALKVNSVPIPRALKRNPTLRPIRSSTPVRDLIFDDIPPLLILLLAHAVEAFLFLRYHSLLPFFALTGKRPSLTPEWMGQLIYIQPATLDYMRDVVIDDSRARKMIGFVLLTLQKLVR